MVCTVHNSSENNHNRYSLRQLVQAQKIQLNIWFSEDDLDAKTGIPSTFVVILKCNTFAEQLKNRKNKQCFIDQALQNPIVTTTTRIQFLVTNIYILVVIDTRTSKFS